MELSLCPNPKFTDCLGLSRKNILYNMNWNKMHLIIQKYMYVLQMVLQTENILKTYSIAYLRGALAKQFSMKSVDLNMHMHVHQQQ